VVPGNLEGPHLVTKDPDLAGPVGLDPYRDRGLADVAQQRAEYEQGRSFVATCHAAIFTPPVSPGMFTRNLERHSALK
jgi:hypothetical protein